MREREEGLSVRMSYRGDAYARGLTVISQKNETILSGEVRSIPSGRNCRIHISLFRICFHYVCLLATCIPYPVHLNSTFLFKKLFQLQRVWLM